MSPELASTTPVHKPSFWTGAPNVLKALAGLATALAALLGVLHQVGVVGRAGNRTTTAPQNVVAATTAAPATTTPATTVAPTAPPGTDAEALRSYVDELDLLLLNSGDTRTELNATLDAVRNRTISRELAISRIDDVIDDRRTLLNDVSTKPAPAEVREARRLLREAIALSIEVDRAALSYVDASFDGRTADRDAALREIVDGSARATAKKNAFTSAYNDVRTGLGIERFDGPI
jgi:hypothetical protein